MGTNKTYRTSPENVMLCSRKQKNEKSTAITLKHELCSHDIFSGWNLVGYVFFVNQNQKDNFPGNEGDQNINQCFTHL